MVGLWRNINHSERNMATYEIYLTANSDWFRVVIDSPADAVFGKTSEVSGSMGNLIVSIKNKRISGTSPQYSNHNFNIGIQIITQSSAVQLTICHGSNGTVTVKSSADSVTGVKTNDTDNCQQFQLRLGSPIPPTPIGPETFPPA